MLKRINLIGQMFLIVSNQKVIHKVLLMFKATKLFQNIDLVLVKFTKGLTFKVQKLNV